MLNYEIIKLLLIIKHQTIKLLKINIETFVSCSALTSHFAIDVMQNMTHFLRGRVFFRFFQEVETCTLKYMIFRIAKFVA